MWGPRAWRLGAAIALAALSLLPLPPNGLLASPFPRARRTSAPLPPCAPLGVPEGSWLAHEATETSRKHFSWTQAPPCAYSVGDPEAFLEAFDGRVIAFLGDSQQREFVSDVFGSLLNCCQSQVAVPCNVTLQRNASACAAWALGSDPYPALPMRRVVAWGGRSMTLVFLWAAFADRGELLHDPAALWRRGVGEAQSAVALPLAVEPVSNSTHAWISRFLGGEEHADSLIVAYGTWDLIFDRSKREDSLVGVTDIIRGTTAFAAAVASAADAHPHLRLRSKILWRRIYVDEVDCIPHPTRDGNKRIIQRSDFDRVISSTRDIWGAVGVREWNTERMTDARLGNVTRPINTNYLTYDGQHLYSDVEVMLGWELFSYLRDEVLA